jgi:hypothetical protein
MAAVFNVKRLEMLAIYKKLSTISKSNEVQQNYTTLK